MAVSANYSFALNRNDILRRSFQLAGVLSASEQPSADDYSMASDFMNLELDAIQAEGTVLRSVSRATLTTVASTASYVLPASVLDVLEPAALLVGSEVIETPVEMIDRARYMTLTDKTTEGRPTFAYVEKGSSITIYLWPVPSEVMTLTYQKVAFLYDSDAANIDTDFGRHWHKPIMFCVSSMIARQRNQPESKIAALLSEGERLKRISHVFEQQHGDTQVRPFGASYGFGRW